MSEQNELPSPRQELEIHVPFKTIIKVLATALLVYSLIILAPLIMTLFLAAMLAVTLFPLLRFLNRHRFPGWVGVAIVVGVFISIATVFIVVILPPLVAQTGAIVENLPTIRQEILSHLPLTPSLHAVAAKALAKIAIPNPAEILTPLMSVGAIAASGITQLLLIIIFTVYLLVDGPRTTVWVLAFFKSESRVKLTETAKEISKVVSAYVAGQAITSLICGIYTLAILVWLDVPAALPLAAMAGIFDVLPVLGFFLAAVPAVLLALTLSPVKALTVGILYVVYHGIENYLLVPKIYGNRLRISDLVVLVSLIAAGALAGVLGAIAVLPLVASYPIIERIWLVDLLGRNVIKKHAASEGASLSKT